METTDEKSVSGGPKPKKTRRTYRPKISQKQFEDWRDEQIERMHNAVSIMYEEVSSDHKRIVRATVYLCGHSFYQIEEKED